MKKHVPNLFTLGNLTCGLFAIQSILVHQQLEVAAYWILGGLVFDFLDGMIARLLHVSGELGKQLDSLADMVTFGVVPGLLAYSLLEASGFNFPYLGFLITLFSALRLAKFNLDTRQTDSFIGLPTPANTMVWMAIPFILYSDIDSLSSFFGNRYFLAGLTIVLSFLLTSELPLLALKFKNLSFHDNKIRWIFIGLSGIILFLFGFAYHSVFISLPFIILVYLVVSVINNKIALHSGN